jgi:transposase
MLDHSGSYQASRARRSVPVPAIPPYIIEPIWEHFEALLPEREVDHPLGCHRSRIPDRVVFDKLVQILVFGCAYRRIADDSCSATTLRDRRDEWIACGVIETLRQIALDAYDRFIGLELADVAVDGCITKAPCGGEKAGKSPVDRGKQGIKRSTAVDAGGIPIGGASALGPTTTTRRFWSPPWSALQRRWEGYLIWRACIWIVATTRSSPASVSKSAG